MKHADSVSGGGFLPKATRQQPGAPSMRGSPQRKVEALLVSGIAIVAVSAAAYGLWYAYRLLEGVFSQALLPVPTALFPATAIAVIVGAVAAVVGFVMRRSGVPKRSSTIDQHPEEYGRAA